jgi:GH24 family phage-related lysozyme (muramidase)
MINRLPSLFSQQETPQTRDFSFAKDFIQQPGVEGRRDEYYWDQAAFNGEGAVTSGVGHLVPGTKGMINHRLIGQPISAKDVDKQYEKDVQKHGNAGRDFFGREAFDKLPENVQTVLTSLAFNVGVGKEAYTDAAGKKHRARGIKAYKRMKEAVENFDKESFVDSKGNPRGGGIAGISEELIYSNYNEKPNTFSPRYNTTGGRTNMEMMHMLNQSPTRKPMSTLEPIAPTPPRQPSPQQQYEAARMNRPPLTQPQMAVPDKSHMYPEPKPQIPINKSHMYPPPKTLEEVNQIAQIRPVLQPFRWGSAGGGQGLGRVGRGSRYE